VTGNSDVILNNLGVALEQQGRLAEAAGQYHAAANLEPDRFQGHHNFARVLDRLGRHDEAFVEHREALKLGPDVPFLHQSMGLALISAGLTNDAIREFSEAARLDAHYPLPRVELAKIDLQQGRDQEAVAELKNAVRIAPDSVDILVFTAHVLAANDNAAVRDGRSAFVLTAKANLLTGGTRPDVLDVMGMACAEMGKFEEAQAAAQLALELAKAQKIKDLAPLQQRLVLYQNHQPWRESFRAQ
jgi:tetratricopeptide (TPR) repeat protein